MVCLEPGINRMTQGETIYELVQAPKRVLIVDGDMKLMNSIKSYLLEGHPDMEIEIIEKDADVEIPGKPYDLILTDDQHMPEGNDSNNGKLFRSIAQHSPYADHVILSEEKDPAEVARRAVSAVQGGALDFIYKPKAPDISAIAENIARDVVRAYTMRQLPDNYDEQVLPPPEYEPGEVTNSITEIVEQMQQQPEKDSFASRVEEYISNIIGVTRDVDKEDLERLARSGHQKITKISALQELAIRDFYGEGKIQRPLEWIDQAMGLASQLDDEGRVKHREQIESLRILRGRMLSFLGRGLVEGVAHKDYGPSLEQPSTFKLELLNDVEKNAAQLKLKKPIRPTRGNVATVRVGERDCLRYEDISEDSLRNEAALYLFYRRISRLLGAKQDFMLVPDVQGVVHAHGKEAWAMYREFVEGNSALDEIRRLERRIQNLKTSDDPETKDRVEKTREFQTKVISNLVTQCAYVLAAGPVDLAESIGNMLDDYYEDRVYNRIVRGFDKLFTAAGVKNITAQEAETMIVKARPIHRYLASLEQGFYKDSWYSNSIIQRSGRSMKIYVSDFGSVKRLPLAIDLSTLLCYGHYASVGMHGNQPVQRSSPKELAFVDKFLREYREAVIAFNSIVGQFNSDKSRFMLDEIKHDMGQYPTESSAKLKEFADFMQERKFNSKAFSRLRRKAREGRTPVSVEYIKDLGTFVRNMRPKDQFVPDPEQSPEEYSNVLEDFTRQFYCAHTHRPLLMAGTFCDFIVNRMGPEKNNKDNYRKRYLLLSEMIGTVKNSLRSLYFVRDNIDLSAYKMAQDLAEQKGLPELEQVVKSILDRIQNIYKGQKL